MQGYAMADAVESEAGQAKRLLLGPEMKKMRRRDTESGWNSPRPAHDPHSSPRTPLGFHGPQSDFQALLADSDLSDNGGAHKTLANENTSSIFVLSRLPFLRRESHGKGQGTEGALYSEDEHAN